MSEGGEKRFRYGSQFEAIINASRPQKKWYEVEWKTYFTVKTGYSTFAMTSFLLMFVFGALTIRLSNVCKIQNADGRCCSCVEIADPEQRLQGQTMLYQTSANDIYYGVLMMINSCFGALYIFTGLRDENKYLLFCMVATQTLECLRGLIDVVLEPADTESTAMRNARTYMMWATIAVMVVGWAFLRPVYKLFGWKIFRQGGAKKSIRSMYKMYQTYRALNLLDIQSSFMLFVIFFLYLDVVRWHGYWVFFCFFLCDIQASRYMLKYLKREDMKGVLLSVCCKLFVISWWCLVIAVYFTCYNRYEESRQLTGSWWQLGYVPDLLSVYESYNGLSCLAPYTTHDARTLEVLVANLGQALMFRVGSLVVSIFVCRNFHKGLRDVFYRQSSSSGDRSESLMDNTSIAMNERVNDAPIRSEDRLYGEYSDEEYDPEKYKDSYDD